MEKLNILKGKEHIQGTARLECLLYSYQSDYSDPSLTPFHSDFTKLVTKLEHSNQRFCDVTPFSEEKILLIVLLEIYLL